ncbi:hypothetical protein [uncultured Paraglaciecola sp.]|uniref:hypothetical protein n=1 Tax=uncultured Paraglaciecola sp. TaxID=1765024 RepID=UPI00261FDCB3|nr:hypothetical protein [uncultured Paraglaciecola sp.]
MIFRSAPFGVLVWIIFVICGCGGSGNEGESGYEEAVVGPIKGDRIKKEEINEFLRQTSSSTSTDLQLTLNQEFPYSTDINYDPHVDTVFVGSVNGGGFSNDMVFGFSIIFPKDHIIVNGKCSPEIQLYLDSDMDAETGYSIGEIGADFMIVGQSGWLENTSIYSYGRPIGHSSFTVPSSTPGGSDWHPRLSQENNGSTISCKDGFTKDNTTLKYMVAGHSSSDLLNTESRGIVRTAYSTYGHTILSRPFYIPALTESSSNISDDTLETGLDDVGDNFRNAFLLSNSLDTEITITSEISDKNDIDMFLVYIPEDGIYTFKTHGDLNTEGYIWNENGDFLGHDYNSGTVDNFGIKAELSAGEVYIQVSAENSESGNYTLHGTKGGDINQIDIQGVWDYEVSITSCSNMLEQGEVTWSYHSGEYNMTLYSSNGLESSTCVHIGPYSANSKNGYLANNPISNNQFVSGLNEFMPDKDFQWEQAFFETSNKITLTGIYKSNYQAKIVFTRQ